MKIKLYSDLNEYGPEGFTLFYIYLHGQIEHLVGFDMVSTTITACHKIHTTGNQIVKTVRVTDRKGKHHGCTMFLWKVPEKNRVCTHQRGLIVRNGDRKAMAYAKRAYNNRQKHL